MPPLEAPARAARDRVEGLDAAAGDAEHAGAPLLLTLIVAGDAADNDAATTIALELGRAEEQLGAQELLRERAGRDAAGRRGVGEGPQRRVERREELRALAARQFDLIVL